MEVNLVAADLAPVEVVRPVVYVKGVVVTPGRAKAVVAARRTMGFRSESRGKAKPSRAACALQPLVAAPWSQALRPPFPVRSTA